MSANTSPVESYTFAFTGMTLISNIKARIEQAEQKVASAKDKSVSPSPWRLKAEEYQQQASTLRSAAEDGDTRLVELLLVGGAPVDARSSEGRTALSLADTTSCSACSILALMFEISVMPVKAKV